MRSLVLIAAALIAAPALATPPLPGPPPPALTLVVSVEGLSSEAFDRYRGSYTDGLARLAGGASLSLEAGSAPLLGGPSGLGTIARAGRPGSRTLLVSASDGALSALGDPGPGQSWRFAGSRFEQVTAAPQLPIVAQANAAIGKTIDTAQPALEVPAACAAPPLATRGQTFARAAGDVAAFRASPQMDGTVMAFAAALARDLGLGLTGVTADVLGLGLGATGEILRRDGEASQEACVALHALDRDLGGLFAHLDRGGTDYAVVLAGSGPKPSPLLIWRKGWQPVVVAAPAARADVVPTVAAMIGASSSTNRSDGTCISGLQGVACPTQ